MVSLVRGTEWLVSTSQLKEFTGILKDFLLFSFLFQKILHGSKLGAGICVDKTLLGGLGEARVVEKP